MLQPRKLCSQLLVGLHQIRDLPSQRRDLPILSGEPASLLTGEHEQLLMGHLLRHRHPKIKLRARRPARERHAQRHPIGHGTNA